jgi:uncharacterized protein YodC (DUF2158 family)
VTINDGGPAFPFTERNADSSYYHGHGGMTLRDWFAGQALIVFANYNPPAIAAKLSYGYADEMLAAREVKP